MIDINHVNSQWDWDIEIQSGTVEGRDVFCASSHRVSELLGPDGEPLMVGYERPMLGFDLSKGRAK